MKKPPFLIRVDRQDQKHLKVAYTDRLAKRTDMLSCDKDGNVIKIIEDPGKVITSVDIEDESYQVPVAVAEYISFLETGGKAKEVTEPPDPKVEKKADKRERTGIIKECYNMSARLFKPWAEKNVARIEAADEDDKLFILAKWRRFFGEKPLPGQKPKEAKEAKAA